MRGELIDVCEAAPRDEGVQQQRGGLNKGAQETFTTTATAAKNSPAVVSVAGTNA